MANGPRFMVSKSNVTRPYLLSVDADIPDGAAIKILARGRFSAALPWVQEHINPVRAPLLAPSVETFSIDLIPAPDSIAAPFLYAIRVEGDGQSRMLDAEQLAIGIDLPARHWGLTRPKEGRPFLTLTW